MSDFKITGPGRYKTKRGGFAAEVVGLASNGMWGGYTNFLTHWKTDGTCPLDADDRLIAPWTEPKKGTVWVNVDGVLGVTAFHTRERADDAASSERLACVSVNWTEGEGL